MNEQMRGIVDMPTPTGPPVRLAQDPDCPCVCCQDPVTGCVCSSEAEHCACACSYCLGLGDR